jgi:hypothetical protein
MRYGFYEGIPVLPHPEIPQSVLLVVEEALCEAWERLRTTPQVDFDLLKADEDTVTLKLYEILCDEVFGRHIVGGFSRELFDMPAREPKIRNYDGTKPDKMPDMLIRLVDRSSVVNSQDGLFIECKPVDAKHSIGVHYCNKGIARFVLGEYAWAMTTAMMVGYVMSGYTISSNLTAVLKVRTKLQTVEFPSALQHSKPGKNSEVVHVSRHLRPFRYLENGQQAPAITLRHLWLRRD